MGNPNFLILDEPTNDLDILTLTVLEDFLQTYPGCLLTVSHDRFFLDKLTDHLFILAGDGKVVDWNGTYEEYRMHVREEQRAGRQEASEATSAAAAKTQNASRAPEKSQDEKKAIKRLENQIAKLLEQKEAKLKAAFADEGLDPAGYEKLGKELSAIEGEREAREEEWLELAG